MNIQQFIRARCEPVPEAGCWIWNRSSGSHQYGDGRMNGKHFLAHRLSYEAFIGPIPAGCHVLHRCDVRYCVNPAHLFAGSNTDNIADSVAKGRRKGVTRRRPSGLTYKPMSEAGKRAHQTWSEDDRDRVRILLTTGMSQRAIAAEIGCSQPFVSYVKNNRC